MLQLYTIYNVDKKEYGIPMAFSNHEHATYKVIQHFNQLAIDSLDASMGKTPEEILAEHPQKFNLFYTGQFDPEKGTVHSLKAPELINNCQTLILNKIKADKIIQQEKTKQEKINAAKLKSNKKAL